MREVDDVQHAVDQREPERDQRVDRAGRQAVEDAGTRMLTSNMARLSGWGARARRPQAGVVRPADREHRLRDAKSRGKITWMSLSSTCVMTGARPGSGR